MKKLFPSTNSSKCITFDSVRVAVSFHTLDFQSSVLITSITNLTGMEVKSDVTSDRRIRVPHHPRMVHWLLPCKILGTFVKSLHLVCRCTKYSCLLAFQHRIPIFGYNTHSGIRSRIRLNSTPMSSLAAAGSPVLLCFDQCHDFF